MSQSSRDDLSFREVALGTTRPILAIDDSGTVVFANDPVEDVLGQEPDAVVGNAITGFLQDGEATLDRIRDAADPVTEGGALTVTLRPADGGAVTGELFAAATERDGERFVTLTFDRRADRAAGSDTQLGQLFASSAEPLFLFDREGTIVSYNRQARELLGLSAGALSTRSMREFVAAPAVFVSFLEDVLTADEGRREEFEWQVGADETRPVQVVASPVRQNGEGFVFARARDVTDRNQLQTQRRRRTAALDTVEEGIAILDSTFEHTYVNGSYVDLFGHEDGSDLRGVPIDHLVDDEQVTRDVRTTVQRDGRWQGRIDSPAAGGTTADAAFEELEDSSVVVVAREASAPSPEEPSAGRLSDDRAVEAATAGLAAATDRETVADACIETVTDVLGYDLGCLRFEDGGSLEPAAMTPAAEELVSDSPGFELGRSDAGRAYRTGEPVVREREDAAVGDLLATSVHVPIDDYGVLTVATTDEGMVAPPRLDAVSLLAVSAGIALDRLELDRRLQRRHAGAERSLERTDGVTLTEETISELVGAESRTEIESRVCSTLAATDAYAGAWIAAVDATGERLCLRECAGLPEELLTQFEDVPLSAVADGAVEAAIETGECTVVDGSTLFEGTVQDSGSTDGVGVVPLEHGDKVFGLLAVHVPDAGSFGPGDRRSLDVLGEALSFALSALENERLLLSDEFVQLEFQVTDPSCLAVALSAELDTAISMKRTIRNANDEHLSYVRVEDAAPEEVIRAAESIEGVRNCRVITDYEYGCLVEVTRPSSGAEVMMEFGARMRSAEAESGRGTLVIEAPHSVDVRRIVSTYQSYNPESELLSKRRVDRPVRSAGQLRSDIEDELTEKQLSAVSAAYFSGYYEWPRGSTAEEIADSMGVSASTLHQHLRHAHQKLLSSILEASFSRRL
jgi:PAS domain S-box-containing protein